MSDLVHYLLSLWATLFTLFYPAVTLARPALTRIRIALTKDRAVRISRQEYEDLLACKAALELLDAVGAEQKVSAAVGVDKLAGGGR